MTSNNITTFTVVINIYNKTKQTIDSKQKLIYNQPNVYLHTNGFMKCCTIKCMAQFYNRKTSTNSYSNRCINCIYKTTKNIINKTKMTLK